VSDPSRNNFELPPEQRLIRDERFHPPGSFVEFSREEIEQSIPDRFEKIVNQHAGRLALKMKDRALTYEKLNQAANRIARAILEKRGAESEPIALLFDHGVDVIMAILGVLKAGKFYVVLDASFPPQRLGFELNDSQAGLIVTNARNLHCALTLSDDIRHVLNIDEIGESTYAHNLGLVLPPQSLASLIYTSGSTGAPKGVMREHLTELCQERLTTQEVPIGPTDRLSLIHPLAFATGNYCLLKSLLNGASLFPFDLKSEGIASLAQWLRAEMITVLHLAPAVFRQLAELLSDREELPALRLIRLSGSGITKEDFNLYKNVFSQSVALEIAMGSSEAGTISRVIVDHSFSFPADGLPVGYAARGNEICLINDDGRAVRPGDVGEIAIKSRYLHSGYWRKPELTRAKFIQVSNASAERTYLTGDLGKMLPDGLLIHLGRKDSQIKIRRYRVEVSEIERILLGHPGLKEVAVIARDREQGEKYLVAFVVQRENQAPGLNEVRNFLRKRLPEYMIPSTFVFLDALPLMSSGKVDRRALPDAGNQRPELDTPFVGPRNSIEKVLTEIWAATLGLNGVGIHDNFFDLGGHSLAATRIISRVVHAFRFDIPVKLFSNPRRSPRWRPSSRRSRRIRLVTQIWRACWPSWRRCRRTKRNAACRSRCAKQQSRWT